MTTALLLVASGGGVARSVCLIMVGRPTVLLLAALGIERVGVPLLLLWRDRSVRPMRRGAASAS